MLLAFASISANMEEPEPRRMDWRFVGRRRNFRTTQPGRDFMRALSKPHADVVAPAARGRWLIPRLGVVRLCLFFGCLFAGGCGESTSSIGKLDLVWGRRGISDGRLQKPRAMAIDDEDNQIGRAH